MDETTERTAYTPLRLKAPPALLPPAPRLGRYVVVRHLGSGGMGSVHIAYDEELHRRVAIKLLHDTGDDRHARARMLREAQALARLSHPNVVQIHDIGELGGRIFMAMEYVEGDTLRAWRDQARPGLDEIREKYLQAGRGLAAAHAAGLAHRDFKADNAVLGADGRVRVLDFGLARADAPRATRELPVPEDMSAPDPPDPDADPLAAELTRAGALIGTPAYMSPEQFRGELADARSDQFSFCAALFEALYGARPFAGDDVEELDLAVTAGTVRSPPPAVDLAPRLHQALLRGLARDPAARWPDMDNLLAELTVDRGTDPYASPRLRRRMLFGGVALFALIQAVVLGRAFTRGVAETPATHRDEGVLVWAVFAASWLLMRPVVRDHPHHRAIFQTFMISVTALSLTRVLLAQAGAGLRPMITAEFVVLAACMAVGASFVARWMLLGVALALSVALALALTPDPAPALLRVGYPLLNLTMLTAWTLSARARPR